YCKLKGESKLANLAVITGVSRGLGKSLARLLLESGVDVIGISRTENKKLIQISAEHNQFYQHFSCDLTNITALEQTIDEIQILIEERKQELENVYLINNAGTVQPINQAMNIKSDELTSHVTLN